MSDRKRWFAMLVLLAGGGALAALGNLERDVSLDSVAEIWSDVLRDADLMGLKAARVSAGGEMRLGAELARKLAGTWREDSRDSAYVTAVAAALAPRLQRRAIQYHFRVVDSPEVNAFALPGGHVYVTTGMMSFLTSEAELAAILGHEMSHIDLKHCINRYQYQAALKKVGAEPVGQVADLARSLITIGYSQGQEMDADANGFRLAVEAGYDPGAAHRVFERLWRADGGQARGRPIPSTPAGEVLGSVSGAISGYFRSHPPSEKRAERLRELAARNQRRFAGRGFYVGAANFARRIPRSQQDLPEERTFQTRR